MAKKEYTIADGYYATLEKFKDKITIKIYNVNNINPVMNFSISNKCSDYLYIKNNDNITAFCKSILLLINKYVESDENVYNYQIKE